MKSVAWKPTTAWEGRVDDAVAALEARDFRRIPAVGLVLGSGLGSFAGRMETVASAAFVEIPGFAGAHVEAHAGRIAQGRMDGRDCLVLQGRPHAYEGLRMDEVVFPVAVMQRMGCRRFVLTNAAGGLRPDMRPGDLALITDLVDLHLIEVARGILLPDPAIPAGLFARAARAGRIFDPEMGAQFVAAAHEEGVGLHRSTYASVWGPHYEESATIGALRRIGAGLVGMSTGPEAAWLAATGARVAGLSCITNVAVEHGAAVVSHEEVVEVGGLAGAGFGRLLQAALNRLDPDPAES